MKLSKQNQNHVIIFSSSDDVVSVEEEISYNGTTSTNISIHHDIRNQYVPILKFCTNPGSCRCFSQDTMLEFGEHVE